MGLHCDNSGLLDCMQPEMVLLQVRLIEWRPHTACMHVITCVAGLAAFEMAKAWKISKLITLAARLASCMVMGVLTVVSLCKDGLQDLQ